MKTFIRSIMIAVCGLTAGGTENASGQVQLYPSQWAELNAESFLRWTHGKVASELAAMYDGLEKIWEDPQLGYNLKQMLVNTKWQWKSAAAFNQKLFAPGRSFCYVYPQEYAVHAANREALEALLKLPEGEKINRETSALLSEICRANGEYVICHLFGDFRQYWSEEAREKRGKQETEHHLYDAAGRVNPVALYGLYTEHMMLRRVGQESRGFHEWVKTRADRDGEFQKLADEAVTYYPQEEEALMKMLSMEASWSAIWCMARDGIMTGLKKESRGSNKLNRVNRHIRNLNFEQLPKPQADYIQAKYDMSKVAEGLEIPSDKQDVVQRLAGKITPPANAAAQRANRAELERQKRLLYICNIYRQFLEIKDDVEAWRLNQDPDTYEYHTDERTRKLINATYAEMLLIMTEQGEEYIDLASKINSQATGETLTGELSEIAKAMNTTGFFIKMLVHTFHDILITDKADPKLVAENRDLVLRTMKVGITLEQIRQRFVQHNYYNSERLRYMYFVDHKLRENWDVLSLYAIGAAIEAARQEGMRNY